MITCTLALDEEIQVRGHTSVENQVLTAGVIAEDSVRKSATAGRQIQMLLEFVDKKNILDLIFLRAENLLRMREQ